MVALGKAGTFGPARAAAGPVDREQVKESLRTKLTELVERHEEVARLLGDAATISDKDRFRELSKEYARLDEVARDFNLHRELERDIAAAAKANDTQLVFATMTVRYEKPDGSNENDAKIDAYCAIMGKVAEETGAAFVDLRQIYLAYLRNHNVHLQLDGSLAYENQGLLTYDGVHPTAEGNKLLAQHIPRGIHEAAAK